MDNVISVRFARLSALCLILLAGSAIGGQWKPLCIEGSSCVSPYPDHLIPQDPDAVGPLLTSEGFLLHHFPNSYPRKSRPQIFQLSDSGMEDFGGGFYLLTDANAVQGPDGRIFSFWLGSIGGAWAWTTTDKIVETIDWAGRTWKGLLNSNMTGPPVVVGNYMYIGISGPAWQTINMSSDGGSTWTERFTGLRINGDTWNIGCCRYNLMANPENNGLWAITSEIFEFMEGLWESTDHGVTWKRVGFGTFPREAVRVVHDPINSHISYALTSNGLYISLNRGGFWLSTSMTEPVHGLVFVERFDQLSRALIVGTDTGIKVSVDEGFTWLDMSKSLLEIPHTVTYGHGQLIATSDAGYFTCNTVDCAGLSQPLPPEEESGIVEVTEFYNTDLDHYFITASQADVDFIDQGKAGEGWVHTGETFLAWSLGSNVEAANVCRFYGSMHPGPNSHFFTLSTQDCSFLMELQETQPATEPRWNFEGYAFSIMPSLQDKEQPCSEGFVPVYRAYNNGYQQGKDSNHRYVTDVDLLTPMIAEGWTNEGVAFCSPVE